MLKVQPALADAGSCTNRIKHMGILTPHESINISTLLDLADLNQLRRFTREEFYTMDRAGIFDNDYCVELIDGRIITRMAPIGGDHAWSVGKLTRILIHCTDDTEYDVHVQSAVSLPGDRELQPDLVVFKPKGDDAHDNPRADQTVLVIEVADSSLRTDRTDKMQLYAEANIPVYWVVDVKHKCVLVYSNPQDGVYSHLKQFSTEDRLEVCGREFVVKSIF
jgi:Uma2 family endonuclease